VFEQQQGASVVLDLSCGSGMMTRKLVSIVKQCCVFRLLHLTETARNSFDVNCMISKRCSL
jgi:ubiquinone/menaquinone biosynthesis C-methylase UbiE